MSCNFCYVVPLKVDGESLLNISIVLEIISRVWEIILIKSVLKKSQLPMYRVAHLSHEEVFLCELPSDKKNRLPPEC